MAKREDARKRAALAIIDIVEAAKRLVEAEKELREGRNERS